MVDVEPPPSSFEAGFAAAQRSVLPRAHVDAARAAGIAALNGARHARTRGNVHTPISSDARLARIFGGFKEGFAVGSRAAALVSQRASKNASTSSEYEDRWDSRGWLASDYAIRFAASLANQSSSIAAASAVTSGSTVSGRIGIATLHYGFHGASCAIVKWCYAAAALASAPFMSARSAEAVVLTDAPSSVNGVCWPRPRIVPFDAELRGLSARWAARRKAASRAGSEKKAQNNGHVGAQNFSSATLMKWQVYSLLTYDVVLFLDTDVDLFLHTAGRPPDVGTRDYVLFASAWSHAYDAFVTSGAQLLASADPHVPINTGVFLARPSMGVYNLGVRALATGVFSFARGFNHSGPPQATLAPRIRPIERTRMWRANTWNVVNGDGDQGLFAHVFLGLLRGATTAFTTRHRTWRVHHYFAPHKPWGLHARCLSYFDFLVQPDFQIAAMSSSELRSPFAAKCLARFQQKRSCLLAESPQTCVACYWRRDKAPGCSTLHAKPSDARPNCPKQTHWWVL